MLHECRKTGGQDLRQPLFARIVEGAGQQQRAGVVVDAITMRAIGHRMYGMLEQSGVIAHRQEMTDLHVGRRGAARFGEAVSERATTLSQWPCRAFSKTDT